MFRSVLWRSCVPKTPLLWTRSSVNSTLGSVCAGRVRRNRVLAVYAMNVPFESAAAQAVLGGKRCLFIFCAISMA